MTSSPLPLPKRAPRAVIALGRAWRAFLRLIRVVARWVALALLVLVPTLALGCAILWLLPSYFGRPYVGVDRLKAMSDARTAGVAYLVAVGAVTTVLFTARTYRLTREGQVTDRYSKAVEQLGDADGKKLMVRLGGIYALERIATDSARDRSTVVEVLSAFLRVQPDPPLNPKGDHEPEQDALVAAQVLGRLPNGGGKRGRLSHARLQRFYLHGLNLGGVDLFNAQLQGSDLGFTSLRQAFLRHADMSGCNLLGTDLADADLTFAKLELAFTYLPESRRAARLGTNFSGAKLEGVRLQGADLRLAVGLTQAQLDTAHGDQDTQLPGNLSRPGTWV